MKAVLIIILAAISFSASAQWYRIDLKLKKKHKRRTGSLSDESDKVIKEEKLRTTWSTQETDSQLLNAILGVDSKYCDKFQKKPMRVLTCKSGYSISPRARLIGTLSEFFPPSHHLHKYLFFEKNSEDLCSYIG